MISTFWTNLFRSRLSIFLEAELAQERSESTSLARYFDGELHLQRLRHAAECDRLESRHNSEIARLESLHQTIEFEAMRELAEAKKAHAAELARVINDSQKMWDELTKMRYVQTPALQTVDLEPDRKPPSLSPASGQGTPWQQVLRREMQKQEEEAASVRFTKPVSDVGVSEGEPVHAESIGRDAAP